MDFAVQNAQPPQALHQHTAFTGVAIQNARPWPFRMVGPNIAVQNAQPFFVDAAASGTMLFSAFMDVAVQNAGPSWASLFRTFCLPLTLPFGIMFVDVAIQNAQPSHFFLFTSAFADIAAQNADALRRHHSEYVILAWPYQTLLSGMLDCKSCC
jgi:hypothetical protein